MDNSLCAHCQKCGEVKYDGFLCDETGYIESKTISTGCHHFIDDYKYFIDQIAAEFEKIQSNESGGDPDAR